MEESVILIVKAPNQQIEDQTILCEMNWTIKRLKGHLSEVYPSKPRSEDQKLIYSGQLLSDNVVLKDVLRSYEGQKNHTVHLVCSPTKESLKSTAPSTNKPAAMPPTRTAPASDQTPSSSSNEGLRRRVPASYPATMPPQPQWPFSFTPPPPGYMPPAPATAAGTYDSAAMAQQMAWMQQAYAQYMAQYMQLMASGAAPAMMQMPGAAPAAPAHHPPLRQEQAPDNPQPPNADEEELRGNRDWLDWFYIMSRMLVLFSIVYFYSSPVRFFVVSTLGIIMYLYQVGFFRAVQRLDQPEEPARPATPPPTPDNNNTPPPPDTPPAPPAPPSPLALTWAAFSSFFLSLIPEQPNVL